MATVKAIGESSGGHKEEGQSSKHYRSDFVALPPRIFSTNRYPPDGQINSYSKPEYLLDIVQSLEGTPEFERLMNSPFGSLFQLPLKKCSLLGKLLHNILYRGVVTAKEHELWFVYAGQPFRFSLREYAIVTGLSCGPYPPPATITEMHTPPEGQKRYWDTLIGSKHATSIQEIVNMLKRDQKKPMNKRMPGWRRLRLALVVIVEGIIICGSQPVRASIEVVEVIRNLDSFMAYPWGRESFELTLRMIKVGSRVDNLDTLVEKFLQSHTLCHGAIQLFIFRSIPLLEQYLPDGEDASFAETEKVQLTKLKTFHNNNILQSEYDPKVEVEHILYTEEPFDEDTPTWSSEVEDQAVDNFLQLIEEGYDFKVADWEGGYSGCALMTHGPQKRVADNLKGKQKKVEKHKAERVCPHVEEEKNSFDSDDILYQVEVINYSHIAEIKKWWEGQKSRLRAELKREIVADLLRSGLSNRGGGRVGESAEEEEKDIDPPVWQGNEFVEEGDNGKAVDMVARNFVDKLFPLVHHAEQGAENHTAVVGDNIAHPEQVDKLNRTIWRGYSGVSIVLLDLNQLEFVNEKADAFEEERIVNKDESGGQANNANTESNEGIVVTTVDNKCKGIDGGDEILSSEGATDREEKPSEDGDESESDEEEIMDKNEVDDKKAAISEGANTTAVDKLDENIEHGEKRTNASLDPDLVETSRPKRHRIITNTDSTIFQLQTYKTFSLVTIFDNLPQVFIHFGNAINNKWQIYMPTTAINFLHLTF